MSTLSGESMASRGGSLQTIRRRYTVDVTGSVSPEEDVLAWVDSNAPVSIGGLVPNAVTFDENPEIEDLYSVEVQYGAVSAPPSSPETGSVEYRFNFQAQGAHIYNSLETIASYAIPAIESAFGPANYNGAINVVNDNGKLRCEGLQLEPPAETFTIAYYPENAVVSAAYQALVAELCGKVNEFEFLGYPAGSLMLVRVNGGVRTGEDWSIEFGFAYIPNDTDIPVGADITVDEKDGMDLLWVYYGEQVADSTLVKQPICAYVERVWKRADLSALGID